MDDSTEIASTDDERKEEEEQFIPPEDTAESESSEDENKEGYAPNHSLCSTKHMNIMTSWSKHSVVEKADQKYIENAKCSE